MQRYETYKPSGIEWIGEVPGHWEMRKLKYVVSKIGSGVTPKGGATSYVEQGIPLLRSQNVHFDGLKLDDVAYIDKYVHDDMANSKVKANDVLINITGASIGRCYYVTNELGEANVNQHVCILRPNKVIDTVFLNFSMASDVGQNQVWSYQQGGGREGLNFQNLRNFDIPLPPLSEQQAIASYLDGKTQEIREAIEKKEQLIALLKERKQIEISRAVTKGLNPAASLRPSGIEWIGEVPEHWEVRKLRTIIQNLDSGVSVNGSDAESAGEGEIGVLKISCVYNYRFEVQHNKKVIPSDLHRVACPVKGNSIIISRANAPNLVGACGFVPEDIPNIFLPDKLWQTVFFKHTPIYAQYVAYSMTTQGFRSLISSKATGSSPSMQNISKGDFLGCSIPLPPLPEQQAIAQHLDAYCQEIEQAIGGIEKQIASLKEYQQVLISEVVTGKRKVC